MSHVVAAVMTDDAIMQLVSARNDSGAFEELVLRWQVRIRSLCLRITGCSQDADDAMQETFCRAYAARGQFRGQSAFSTWLWRIALNSACDLHRRRRADVVGSTEAGQDVSGTISGERGPIELVQREESARRVIEALRQLPDDVRCVVVLRHYEGLKFREISDVLNVPMGTVCSRMTEGLNRLAVMLRDCGEG